MPAGTRGAHRSSDRSLHRRRATRCAHRQNRSYTADNEWSSTAWRQCPRFSAHSRENGTIGAMSRFAASVFCAPSDVERIERLVVQLPSQARVRITQRNGDIYVGTVTERPALQV